VNCNHQSWVDIFVLQNVLRGRIPLLKFFLKQQLIYVPVIGLAWWALDFPFMRRPWQGGAAPPAAPARPGPRSHAARLPQVLAGADQRDELRRRHPLHVRQARRAGLALPAPAQAERPAHSP
jgi:1-acyl-sn-glycerol-3-phosphate acyltransferase